ncbi:trypsin-like peptidase domain-containing protein [Streptomyces sp. NPDC048241]|uniref:S1C family serine protease n=1 Tax=Streptomyces sp. NPDC048241 TaxID=3365521 RepID=UPI0037237B4A
MNEGNPTPDPSPAGTDGDFELAKPAPADLAGSGATRAPEHAERRDTADTAHPEDGTPPPGTQPATAPPQEPASHGMPPTEPRTEGPGEGAPGTGARPADRRTEVAATEPAAGPLQDPASHGTPPTAPGPRDEGPGEGAPGVRAADPRTEVAATGRPKPLHDPDPYGTPPYGGPGPWAPAPPVQHPLATQAHGIPVGEAPAPVPAAAGSPEAAPVPAPAQSPEAADDPAPQQPPAPRYDPWDPAPPSQQVAAPARTDQRERPTLKKLAVVLLGVSLLAGGVGGFAGAWVEREGSTEVRLPQAGAVPDGRARDSVAGIAARALPGVVTLHVRGADEADTGTGFVLDGRGHILTNNHVVAPASGDGAITVTFSGGETVKAEVVGRDSGYDLAVVQVEGVQGLTPLPLGNSDGVQVGDPVVAIGAPFDLANTVTSGIVSAKDRPITAGGGKGDGTDVSYVDALQTDAPINPGNSGGPLLDSQARVIGVNSAIRSAGGDADSTEGRSGSVGLGFAIPVNQARRVAEELIGTGHATHPVIGVTLDMDYAGDGARIDAKGGAGNPAVLAGGPGDRAGLKPGDLITGVDGRPVHSGEELIVKVRAHRPGDRLRLTVGRAGAERTVTLRLGASGQN